MRNNKRFNTPRNYLKKERYNKALNEILYHHSRCISEIIDKATRRFLEENAQISEAK